MNTLQRCLALTMLLLLTACAGMGGGGEDRMSSAYLKQHLIPGKTTKADVQQLFGTPKSKSESSDLSETWWYTEAQINGGLLDQAVDYMKYVSSTAERAGRTVQKQQPDRNLSIYFNQNGTVSSFSTLGRTGAS